MNKFQMFMYQLKYRFTHLSTGRDYLWAAVVLLNLFFLVRALYNLDIGGIGLSVIFLYICLYDMIRN